jgi:uncharacterized peroxidase-related enzyme
MAFIELPKADEGGEASELYEGDRARFGYVPNFTRGMARRPAAYAAWKALNGAVKGQMDERRYELATLAAARSLRSSYCMLAHGKVLADRFIEPAQLRAIAADHRSAGLDPVDVAVMDLAEKVAADATGVTEADIRRLRELGLDDDDILDVVLAASIRCFFSKALDALGIEPDAAYEELEPQLRDALTVGRPISGS